MSQVTIGVLMLFGTLLFLIIIRIPIAFALGISSVITALYLDIPLVNLFMSLRMEKINMAESLKAVE